MKHRIHFTLGLLVLSAFGQAQAATPVVVIPKPMTGAFETLLMEGDEDTGIPTAKVEINVLTTGKFTGKLTFTETTSPALTGTFILAGDSNSAQVANGLTLKRTGKPDLKLELKLLAAGVLEATLSVPSIPATALRLSTRGVPVKTYLVKELSPWAGTYTLSLSHPTPSGATIPAGHGYASAKIDTKGVLTFTGMTGDGTAITGKSLPAANGGYRIFIKPYGVSVADNFLSGWLILETRSDTKFHIPTGSTTSELYWKKQVNLNDKQYREGFGPLVIAPVLTPWIAPKSPQTIASIMGIESGKIFDIDFGSAFSTTTYATKTPVRLGLTSKNLLVVTAGGAGSPSPFLPAEWAKFFNIKVNASTGVLTGSLTITDSVSTPQPFPRPAIVKTITRKLILGGVLHQLLTLDTGEFAHGYVLVPPLDAKTATQTSGAFAFSGPIIADPLVAASANIPGTYTVTVDQVPSGLGNPTGIPADNATVTFTISADLKSMVFHGRTIPFLGDSRPVAIAFSNAKTSPTNNLIVQVYLNYLGEITGITANYNQFARPLPRVANFNSIIGTVVKQP